MLDIGPNVRAGPALAGARPAGGLPEVSAMPAERIAVLYRSSLLAQGLEALLRNLTSAEVYGIDIDGPNTLARLEALAPATVLVDPQELGDPWREAVLALLQTSPDLCIVYLRFGEDAVEILRKRRLVVGQVEDLLAAIASA